MTPDEMMQFRKDVREMVGESYTVKVSEPIKSAEERKKLIAHIRQQLNDLSATIYIEEPIPDFSFDYEIVPTQTNEITPKTEANEILSKERSKANHIYGESWIVLQNRLLNAITDLNLNERRLIMFLSPLVRKDVDTDPNKRKRLLTVNALDFAEEYGLGKKSVYRTLAQVADSLLYKAFFFWNMKGDTPISKKGVSWLVECDYKENEGCLEIILADTVLEMLTVFDTDNSFTKYQKNMITNLGSYGIILFELIASCMYQDHKQKSYTVKYLREKFNCTETYKQIGDFKLYVLDKAIKDIHEHTPYRISYTQKKLGRVVNDIVFSFKDISDIKAKNTKSLQNSIKRPSWQIKGLSDAQIKKVGYNKKEFIDANNSKISPTDRREYHDIFNDWQSQLKDPITVNDFRMVQELLER